jgi:hypothetical protein
MMKPTLYESVGLVLLAVAALAASFYGWVWFIAWCVKLATSWGWLP